MPKKIRELKNLLLQSGFTYKPAKGSHSKWIHPKLSKAIIIAGKDGSDAKQYLEDVLKVLDETDNLQKPNPPAPFPTREGGFQSLSPLRGEVWRGVCLYIKNFSNTLLEKQVNEAIVELNKIETEEKEESEE